MAECELRVANGQQGVPCDGWRCLYWRLVDHVDSGDGPREGCALQYFRMIEGEDSAMVAWLLSVKERVESQESARAS